MKSLAAFVLWTMTSLTLTGCSTGRVMPENQLTTEEKTWLTGQRIRLVVNVVPANRQSSATVEAQKLVSALATNLSRTGLFAEVITDKADSEPDLQAIVREARGVQRCGNPQILTKATLGLIRDQVGYSCTYDFDLTSPRTGKSLKFQKTYLGRYRAGFWPAPDTGFAGLLKFDLAKMRPEIESLTQQ